MMTRTMRIATVTFATMLGVAGLTGIIGAGGHDDYDDDDQDGEVSHVLLLSVDGLHAFDLERFVANNPDSALARLSEHGRTYTMASATRPSDSFPGMLAMVTGGTPKSTGVYYDDGYDRDLAAANALPRPDASCVGGTRVQWKQNLDATPLTAATFADYAAFWPSFVGMTINASKLPFDQAGGCVARVYPHQFPRVNNVFELINAARGRTAWSDKHSPYEFLSGLSGKGLDDLYTPEIATTVGGVLITNSFALTMAYDDMKVAAIVNEINGFDHSGTTPAETPALFGMNFQAVSVGQKLIEKHVTGDIVGGYLDAAGTPSPSLQAALDHTDQSIEAMVSALGARGLLDSTLIIITAKHGNSPVDLTTLVRVDPAVISSLVNAVAPGLLAQLSADTGPLIWLKDRSTNATDAVVAALTASMTNGVNPARIAGILSGSKLAALYADPHTDSRVPDIILQALPGTVYTTSPTKIADHGGFGDEDVHVALLVSNTELRRRTIDYPVETRQIACTILRAFHMDCDRLRSEQVEPSNSLPRKQRHYDGDDDRDCDRSDRDR